MNREPERTPRTQRRTAVDVNSSYEADNSSYNDAPKRRRSQAARMQMQDDVRDIGSSDFESRAGSQRSGRRQLPERPQMRFTDEEEEARFKSDAYQSYRPQRNPSEFDPAQSRSTNRRTNVMLESFEDEPEELDIKPASKPRLVKWLIIGFIILLFVGGAAYLTINRQLVEPYVQKAYELIFGASATPEPTPEPTPVPTEVPPVPREMASVIEFSIDKTGDIQVNDTVTFEVITSNLTDRIYIMDGNGTELVQIAGADMYTDEEDGRHWNVMYTFITPYEGVLEANPGNESGWNEASGSHIDIVVVDPAAGSTTEGSQQSAAGGYTVQMASTQVSPITLEELVLVKNEPATDYSRANAVQIGASGAYSATGDNAMNGVLTFRGDNLRQNSAFGTAALTQKTLESAWMVNVGVPGDGGRMWNVQPLIVQWHDTFRKLMKMADDKANKSLLKEVIFASNDGKVYFIDLEDGSVSREKITLRDPPLSMMATPSLYPSGIPMLFFGTGDPAYLAEDVNSTGMYMYNLMTEKTMKLIGGSNNNALSSDATFITSPLIDRNTGVMLAAGGNGILYTVSLNIDVNRETYEPSMVSPTVEMYIANTAEGANTTVFSSLAVYNNIAYIATQGGVLQAVDINTLKTVWALELGQETDAAISIDPDELGNVSVYAVTRPDENGKSHVRRIDASTGVVHWDVEITGAVSASMLIGTNSLSNMIYVAAEEPSVLYALYKGDGQLIWNRPLKAGKSSAPMAMYTEEGTGYVVQGDEGAVYLLDGQNGDKYSSVAIEGSVVGSPSAFNDMITLATSAGKLYGIRAN